MRMAITLIVATALTAAFSLTVMAQQGPGGGPGQAIQQGQEKQITPEQFSAMKSRLLQMIEQRRQQLGQEKTCVEAATTPEELRKCRPARPGMGPGNRGQRGPRQQMPPQSPAAQPQ